MVAACENSGKSIKQWCQENGIPVGTYESRRQRVREAAQEYHQQEIQADNLQVQTDEKLRQYQTSKILECQSSGLPIRTWCKIQGISTSTYYRWQKEVQKEAIKAMEKEQLPVGTPSESIPPLSASQKEDLEALASPTDARLKEYRDMVADCEKSGLSIREWCARECIPEGTYYSRLQRLKEALIQLPDTQEITSVSPPPFVELQVALPEPTEKTTSSSGNKAAIRVNINGGDTILDIPREANIRLVETILRVLTKQC